MAKKTPGINAGSMSDISFLLLTFFLLTSNINTDMGITRLLPPPVPDNAEVPDIKRRNVFEVKLRYDDRLFFDGQIGDLRALKIRAKEFLGNPKDMPNLPEKEEQEIPLLGKTMVSKGVISLQNDKGTSYNMYIQVQDELTSAVNEMRNELSITRFGKQYVDLPADYKKAIDKAIPVAISEAEPKNAGGI